PMRVRLILLPPARALADLLPGKIRLPILLQVGDDFQFDRGPGRSQSNPFLGNAKRKLEVKIKSPPPGLQSRGRANRNTTCGEITLSRFPFPFLFPCLLWRVQSWWP